MYTLNNFMSNPKKDMCNNIQLSDFEQDRHYFRF